MTTTTSVTPGQPYRPARDFTVGDTVHIDPEDSPKWAGTYTVAKINPTTLGLVRVGDGARLKAHRELVKPGQREARPGGSVTVAPLPQYFDPGTVVQKAGSTGYWVVTGTTAKGHRIFPLGGSTRYFTNVPAHRLTRVTEITDWKA